MLYSETDIGNGLCNVIIVGFELDGHLALDFILCVCVCVCIYNAHLNPFGHHRRTQRGGHESHAPSPPIGHDAAVFYVKVVKKFSAARAIQGRIQGGGLGGFNPLNPEFF